MKLIINVFEMYTEYNDKEGGWSDISGHTEGVLGVKSGTVTNLVDLNEAIQVGGHPSLTKESLEAGAWEANDDEEGRFDYNFIGTSDGTPDEDGKYLYDISIWLYEVDPQPVSKAALLKELS